MKSEHSKELITIAICTYARHELLKAAVAASLEQSVDRNLFKVLIIDNSPDRAGAEEFYRAANLDPRVTIEWSQPPGLSRARNRAIELCQTPFIAFLDDDAIPDPGWLNALLSGFQQNSEVAVVGGPIAPLWEQGQPAWMPDRHLAMYGVFHPYDYDSDLGPKDYLYGGNVAFDLASLKEVGGFPEEIGRIGSHGLLSNEEYRPQQALRQKGRRIRYVIAARIRHLMHQEKLRRGWMRARTVWQNVSDQLLDPPFFNREHSLNELARLVRAYPEVATAARLFFAPEEGDRLGLQLDLISHFFALLLSEHRADDVGLDGILTEQGKRLATEPNVNDCVSKSEGATPSACCEALSYAPSAAGAALASHLFIEGLPGHRNLYDLYGDLPGAQLLPYWFGNGEDSMFEQDLAFISRSIGPASKNLFFITLDQPAYYRPHREAFFRFLQACPLPVYGILHVMPQTEDRIEAVQRLGKLVTGVCFLARTMAEDAGATLKLSNALYLPLHPATVLPFHKALRERDTVRAKLGVLPHQTVFSVLGEARRGKGIELVLRSLDHIPNEKRGQLFFLFAGKATDQDAAEVRAALESSGTAGIVDLRKNAQMYEHAVLSDREYAEYVGASDVALVLYQEEQRHRMSGVLPDFVWANCIAIATADSYVGSEVERNGLGITLQSEKPESLATILVDALVKHRHSKSSKFLNYRAEIAPESVLQRLLAIMDADPLDKPLSSRVWEQNFVPSRPC